MSVERAFDEGREGERARAWAEPATVAEMDAAHHYHVVESDAARVAAHGPDADSVAATLEEAEAMADDARDQLSGSGWRARARLSPFTGAVDAYFEGPAGTRRVQVRPCADPECPAWRSHARDFRARARAALLAVNDRR